MEEKSILATTQIQVRKTVVTTRIPHGNEKKNSRKKKDTRRKDWTQYDRKKKKRKKDDTKQNT
jgi:hypothetical protein